MDSSRESILFRAIIAQRAERYDEMFKHVTRLVRGAKSLSSNELNLMSKAFKNTVDIRRTAIRSVKKFMEENVLKENSSLYEQEAHKYLRTLEEELSRLCIEIVELLTTTALRKERSEEGAIFLTKLTADYYRYMCEILGEEYREKNKLNAQEYYKEGMGKSVEFLPGDNPVRLSIFLNYSVFLYEVMQEQDEAILIAKHALQEGIKKIEETKQEPEADTTRILQLIRDNVTMWLIADEMHNREKCQDGKIPEC